MQMYSDTESDAFDPNNLTEEGYEAGKEYTITIKGQKISLATFPSQVLDISTQVATSFPVWVYPCIHLDV